MPTTAKIIADSINESGQRLTTLVLEYPRIVHSEFMTHRMFSRNASSSRAIKVEAQCDRVDQDGFIPAYLGKNQAGMQAYAEVSEEDRELILTEWNINKNNAVNSARWLAGKGLHKQLANRLLEPFSHIQVVVTATEFDNFFTQRLHPAAQPEIQELARVMKEVMDNSRPTTMRVGDWHLPFVDLIEDASNFYKYWRAEDRLNHPLTHIPIIEILVRLSVARCARVSYGLNERGWGDIEKDLALYDMLKDSGHWSPFEHQATPMIAGDVELLMEGKYWQQGITHADKHDKYWSANFKGFIQNRQLIQQQHDTN